MKFLDKVKVVNLKDSYEKENIKLDEKKNRDPYKYNS